MPLYEFECDNCGRRFEHLTRADQKPSCPSCHGEKLSRLLSVFAVASGQSANARGSAPGPCGSCGDPRGPGACSMN